MKANQRAFFVMLYRHVLMVINTLMIINCILFNDGIGLVNTTSLGNIFLRLELDRNAMIWKQVNYRNGRVDRNSLGNGTSPITNNFAYMLPSSVNAKTDFTSITFNLNFTVEDGANFNIISNSHLNVEWKNSKVYLGALDDNLNSWIAAESMINNTSNIQTLEFSFTKSNLDLSLNGMRNSFTNVFSTKDTFLNFITNSSMLYLDSNPHLDDLKVYISTNKYSWTCFDLTPDDPMVCSGMGVCTEPDNCICNDEYSSYYLAPNCSVMFRKGDMTTVNTDGTVMSSTVTTNGIQVGHCLLGKDGNCHDPATNDDLGYSSDVLLVSNLESGPLCSSITDLMSDSRCNLESFRKQKTTDSSPGNGAIISDATFSIPVDILSTYKGEPTSFDVVDQTSGTKISCVQTLLSKGVERGTLTMQFFDPGTADASFCWTNNPIVRNIVHDDFTFQFYFSANAVGINMTLFDFPNRFKVYINDQSKITVDMTPIDQGSILVADTIIKLNFYYGVIITKNIDGEVKIYVNGYPMVRKVITMKLDISAAGSSNYIIGRNSNGGWNFIGTIDKIKISQRSLGTTEIMSSTPPTPEIFCKGINSLDQNVCSGNGVCQKNDTCICDQGFLGNNCEQPLSCFGKYLNDSSICSGNGVCISLDKCACFSYASWKGDDCSVKVTPNTKSPYCSPNGLYQEYTANLEQKYNAKQELTLTVKQLSICKYFLSFKKYSLGQFTIKVNTTQTVGITPESVLDKLVSVQEVNGNVTVSIDTSLVEESDAPNIIKVSPSGEVYKETLATPKITSSSTGSNTDTKRPQSRTLVNYPFYYSITLSGNEMLIYEYEMGNLNTPTATYTYYDESFSPEQIRYGTPISRDDGDLNFYIPIIDTSGNTSPTISKQTIHKLRIRSSGVSISSFQIENDPSSVPYVFIFDGFDENMVTLNEMGINVYSLTDVQVNNTLNSGNTIPNNSTTTLSLKYSSKTITSKNYNKVFQTNTAVVVAKDDGKDILCVPLSATDAEVPHFIEINPTVYLPQAKTYFFDDSLFVSIIITNSTGNSSNVFTNSTSNYAPNQNSSQISNNSNLNSSNQIQNQTVSNSSVSVQSLNITSQANGSSFSNSTNGNMTLSNSSNVSNSSVDVLVSNSSVVNSTQNSSASATLSSNSTNYLTNSSTISNTSDIAYINDTITIDTFNNSSQKGFSNSSISSNSSGNSVNNVNGSSVASNVSDSNSFTNITSNSSSSNTTDNSGKNNATNVNGNSSLSSNSSITNNTMNLLTNSSSSSNGSLSNSTVSSNENISSNGTSNSTTNNGTSSTLSLNQTNSSNGTSNSTMNNGSTLNSTSGVTTNNTSQNGFSNSSISSNSSGNSMNNVNGSSIIQNVSNITSNNTSMNGNSSNTSNSNSTNSNSNSLNVQSNNSSGVSNSSYFENYSNSTTSNATSNSTSVNISSTFSNYTQSNSISNSSVTANNSNQSLVSNSSNINNSNSGNMNGTNSSSNNTSLSSSNNTQSGNNLNNTNLSNTTIVDNTTLNQQSALNSTSLISNNTSNSIHNSTNLNVNNTTMNDSNGNNTTSSNSSNIGNNSTNISSNRTLSNNNNSNVINTTTSLNNSSESINLNNSSSSSNHSISNNSTTASLSENNSTISNNNSSNSLNSSNVENINSTLINTLNSTIAMNETDSNSSNSTLNSTLIENENKLNNSNSNASSVNVDNRNNMNNTTIPSNSSNNIGNNNLNNTSPNLDDKSTNTNNESSIIILNSTIINVNVSNLTNSTINNITTIISSPTRNNETNQSIEVTPKVICFGVDQKSNLTCSGNGECISNDTCKCLPNYIGSDCSIAVCFGISGANSSVCNGNGKCIGADLCDCKDGFTGQLCQYQTVTELCTGSFVPAEQITVISSNIYLQKSLIDTVCGKSLVLQSTTLLEDIPSNVTNSNLLKYYTITNDKDNSGDKYLTFDTILYKSKIPNSLIIWKIDKFSNATQMIIPISNAEEGNSTYGLVKILDNPNGDLLGITLKDNSTNVTILEIDTSNKEANISSVFSKGSITFSDIDKGNQVFNPSTNTTTFTFFKEGTSNSSLLLSLNLETPTETPKEVVIPQTTQKYFTLVLFDYPDQYLLSSDQEKTTISTIVPDITSDSPEFNPLASDSNFIVNKDDLVVLTKDSEKITVVNVNTDVSLIIAVSQLTPDPSVFDQSTQFTKSQPIAYVSNDQTESTVLSIRKIYPLYVPISGSIPIYLEGNFVLPGTIPYLILKYTPLDLMIARLPIQTQGTKSFVNSKDISSILPSELGSMDTFKVSVQIQLISENSDPIPISTSTELTLYRFDLLKVLPKQAYYGDNILAVATFFPPNNNVNLFIRPQFATEETKISCTVLNSTFCSAKLPMLQSTDVILNIRASLSQDLVSSSYDNGLYIRYVDPDVVKVASLDNFDTSVSPPEDIPDQDSTPPIVERKESIDSVQPPLILKMNIGKLNKSKCTDKPIRQIVASSDLHDISNVISLDFKLSPFSNIENGNLIEFWISKKLNGTFFGSLAFENGKQVLTAGELSSGVKSSTSCTFTSGVSYRISMKLGASRTKWELKNINIDMIECSLDFSSDNSKILENPKAYQFGIGQSFSCAQLLSNISQIPDLTVNSMMEVCSSCAKPVFSIDQQDFMPYIVGGSIGLVILVALIVAALVAASWYLIRRRRRNTVGKYIYYDNNANRENTLEDLFEKINTNSSYNESSVSTSEEFLDKDGESIDDLMTSGSSMNYNTWV